MFDEIRPDVFLPGGRQGAVRESLHPDSLEVPENAHIPWARGEFYPVFPGFRRKSRKESHTRNCVHRRYEIAQARWRRSPTRTRITENHRELHSTEIPRLQKNTTTHDTQVIFRIRKDTIDETGSSIFVNFDKKARKTRENERHTGAVILPTSSVLFCPDISGLAV